LGRKPDRGYASGKKKNTGVYNIKSERLCIGAGNEHHLDNNKTGIVLRERFFAWKREEKYGNPSDS